MTERIQVDAGSIVVPISVRDKDNPAQRHDVDLIMDISDKALIEAKQQAKETKLKLNDLLAEYKDIMSDDFELNNDNLARAVEAVTSILRTRFDADYGDGEYDRIASIGGGNSFINMFDLYDQANDFVGKIIDKKMERMNKKSQNKMQKYLAKLKKNKK